MLMILVLYLLLGAQCIWEFRNRPRVCPQEAFPTRLVQYGRRRDRGRIVETTPSSAGEGVSSKNRIEATVDTEAANNKHITDVVAEVKQDTSNNPWKSKLPPITGTLQQRRDKYQEKGALQRYLEDLRAPTAPGEEPRLVQAMKAVTWFSVILLVLVEIFVSAKMGKAPPEPVPTVEGSRVATVRVEQTQPTRDDN